MKKIQNTSAFYSWFEKGARAELLHIEASAFFQIPSWTITGLGGTEIQEAKERVRCALMASGFAIPNRKIIFNLCPAHEPKRSTHLDLALALSLCAISQNIALPSDRIFTYGELGLTGQVKATETWRSAIGVLLRTPFALAILPASLGDEFNALTKMFPVLEQQKVIFIHTLHEIFSVFKIQNRAPLRKKDSLPYASLSHSTVASAPSFRPFRISKKWLKISKVALVGAHHVLLSGPKGTGKTTAVNQIHHFLPPLTGAEEFSRANALLGEDVNGSGSRVRVVSPHIRSDHLLGSWDRQRGFVPGEFSRAHQGVLVADEFLEWPRDAREALRAPLEGQPIVLVRRGVRTEVPAHFLFFGTANECPCGETHCVCRAGDRNKYWQRLSGPIADRIDIHASLRVNDESIEMSEGAVNEIRTAIMAARAKRAHIHFDEENMPLPPFTSYRDREKIIGLSRSIAALDHASNVQLHHLEEAILLRKNPHLPI